MKGTRASATLYYQKLLIVASNRAAIGATRHSELMEAVLESLRSSVGDQEFLRLTRSALRLIQNILNDPAHEKYKKIRAASKVCEFI